MRQLFKNILWVSFGALAGVVVTWQLSATAQQSASLPLDELRLFSTVFGSVKRDYVEPIDDKKTKV